MDTLLQDLGYAVRALRRNVGFATIVVLTLAIGVGANIAVFSVIQSVLLRPLPYPDADRLVSIWTTSQQSSGRTGTSGPAFTDYKAQSQSLSYVAQLVPRFTYTWTGHGEPRTVVCTGISSDFFPMLGVHPLLGRLYTPEEYHVDGVQVVISERLWREELGADPQIIGRVLNLDGTAQTVIGVMPPLPDLYPDTDVWAKVVPDFAWMQSRSNRFLTVIGQLKHGVTRQQAEQEMTTILRRSEPQSSQLTIQIVPLKEELVGSSRVQLSLLMAAVALVLLIGCGNVAYLLLARNARRQSEIAVRLSLGASRLRLVRLFVTENLVLAGLGGVFGLLLALPTVRFFTKANPGHLPRAEVIGLDASVLLFAVGLAIVTSLLLAWAPTRMFSQLARLQSTLRSGRSDSGAGQWARLRLLLISEVALTMVLLVGAGLLLRSFLEVTHVNAGFSPDHLLTAYLRSNDPQAGRQFYATLLDRTAALPGVQGSAVSDCMPGASAKAATLTFDDRANDPFNVPRVQSCWISPDYFRVIGAPLRNGRLFTAHDTDTAPMVVIINDAMARAYWPGQDPVGKRIATDPVGAGRNRNAVPPLREIVGVVADIKQKGLDVPVEPAVYLPYLQDQTNHVFAGLNLFVRGAPAGLVSAVRTQVHALRPDQPIQAMRTMDAVLDQTLAPRRFILTMFSLYAGLALLLAAIGVFGMIAYAVSQRTREMGLRLALGALPSDILQLVLKQSLVLVVVGIVIGGLVSRASSTAISGLLFGITAADPLTFAAAALIVFVASCVACLIPAWRAASTDPLIALRSE